LKHNTDQYAASQISGKNNVPSFHCEFNVPGVAQQLNPFLFSWLDFPTLNFGGEFFEILLVPLLDCG
jgi:hypothetical protein